MTEAIDLEQVDLARTAIPDTREGLDALTDRVAETGERIILTRDGKEVAALVHVDDARFMQALEDRIDSEAADAALTEVAEHGTIPWEVLRAELNR